MKVHSVLDIVGGIFLIAIVALLLKNATAVTNFVKSFQGLLSTALKG